jgi:hypothetical protein
VAVSEESLGVLDYLVDVEAITRVSAVDHYSSLEWTLHAADRVTALLALRSGVGESLVKLILRPDEYLR